MWTFAQQPFGNLRHLVDEVFAIIDEEQHLLLLQVAQHGFHRRLIQLLHGAQRQRNGACNERRVTDRRQFHEPDAVGPAVDFLRGDFERCACLANTTGAHQCNESCIGK